jgi:hypothetical protein
MPNGGFEKKYGLPKCVIRSKDKWIAMREPNVVNEKTFREDVLEIIIDGIKTNEPVLKTVERVCMVLERIANGLPKDSTSANTFADVFSYTIWQGYGDYYVEILMQANRQNWEIGSLSINQGAIGQRCMDREYILREARGNRSV